MENGKPISKHELEEAISTIDLKIDGVELRLRTEIESLRKEVKAQTKDIIEHFNVVAEQIQCNMASANSDEISAINDKLVGHEERISQLEESQ